MAMLTLQNLIDDDWYWCHLRSSWCHDEYDHSYREVGNSVQRRD